MANTCYYQWTLITDDNEIVDILQPPKDHIDFEIFHDSEREHEVCGIVGSTIPLTFQQVKEEVEDYSNFYGVPVPTNIDSIIDSFIQRSGSNGL